MIQGYKNKENTVNGQFVLAIFQTSRLIRKIFRLRTELELCEIIRNLMQLSANDNETYQTIIELFNRFIQTTNIEHLLKLYTIDARLCKILQQEKKMLSQRYSIYV